MHLVTSFLFVPAYIAALSPASIVLFLRVYLASTLTVWVAVRRPRISIADFYANSPPSLSVPGSHPTPDKGSLAASSHDGTHPNPWIPLLQSTIVHPDEHLPKAQRALAHYAREYGTREKGHWAGKEVELDGVEKLDGTIFARVAGLTMGRLGWMREGEARGDWDGLPFGGTIVVQTAKNDL